MILLINFNYLVSVLFFEGDCWQFFKRGIYLVPDSWAYERD